MNGLIAFFGILGYQSFLQNNSATKTAEKVLTLITDLPEQTKAEVSIKHLEMYQSLPTIPLKEVTASLNYLVFSDTIVLSIQFPENPAKEWIKPALNSLTVICGKLQLEMVKEGLRMRGAIVEGEFLVRQHCF